MSAGETVKRALGVSAAAAVIVAGVWIWGQCQYAAGAKHQQLVTAGDSTDRWRARHIEEDLERETQVRRDSAAHAAELARERARTAAARQLGDSLEAALRARPDSLFSRDDVVQLVAAKNATIARQDSTHRADSLAILFWQGVAADRAKSNGVVAKQRDDYRGQRDAWRKQARPRCGADVGAGYGLNTRQWDAWVGVGCRIPLPRLPFL